MFNWSSDWLLVLRPRQFTFDCSLGVCSGCCSAAVLQCCSALSRVGNSSPHVLQTAIYQMKVYSGRISNLNIKYETNGWWSPGQWLHRTHSHHTVHTADWKWTLFWSIRFTNEFLFRKRISYICSFNKVCNWKIFYAHRDIYTGTGTRYIREYLFIYSRLFMKTDFLLRMCWQHLGNKSRARSGGGNGGSHHRTSGPQPDLSPVISSGSSWTPRPNCSW